MSKKFDFKITTWERITVPEEMEKQIQQKIESGEITTGNEIFDHCSEATLEKLTDVDEYMDIEANGQASTIEIMEEGNIVWKNGME